MAPVHTKAVADLGCQLPGWREHQGTDGPAVGGFLCGQVMENREGKGCGFPRPCLGDAEHITAVHQGGNGFRLHWGWRSVAFGVKGLEYSLVKVEFGEG